MGTKNSEVASNNLNLYRYHTCSHSQAIIPLLILELELDDELRIGAVEEEEEEEEEVEDVPFLHPTITPYKKS